jgi:coiled-coil domain-containing protein 61
VEEITQKTGSFKRFPIFVRMLRSAVSQESESVFVDLLSYTDLEALKNK